jgi:hypothetical protein
VSASACCLGQRVVHSDGIGRCRLRMQPQPCQRSSTKVTNPRDSCKASTRLLDPRDPTTRSLRMMVSSSFAGFSPFLESACSIFFSCGIGKTEPEVEANLVHTSFLFRAMGSRRVVDVSRSWRKRSVILQQPTSMNRRTLAARPKAPADRINHISDDDSMRPCFGVQEAERHHALPKLQGCQPHTTTLKHRVRFGRRGWSLSNSSYSYNYRYRYSTCNFVKCASSARLAAWTRTQTGARRAEHQSARPNRDRISISGREAVKYHLVR